MFSVSGSTSTRIGLAPACSMTWTLEQNVMVVVITESPGPTPSAARATCIAAVPELTASAAGAPTISAKDRSKDCTLGPVVIQPDRRVSTTSLISSSPIDGGENGREVLRAGLVWEWPWLLRAAFRWRRGNRPPPAAPVV